jgi:hypothetical protein
MSEVRFVGLHRRLVLRQLRRSLTPPQEKTSMSLTRTLTTALTLAVLFMPSPTDGQTPTPAPAHESKTTAGSRTFEMRTYYAHPGKIEDLHKRFREHTATLFKKHGMENVGYWVPNDKPDVLVYILAYPSKEAADASWKAFREDPEWQKARAASEANGPLVAKVESSWLRSTDYSPIR